MTDTPAPQQIEQAPAGHLAPTTTPLRQTIVWLLEGNAIPDVTEAIAAAYPEQDPQKLIAAAGEHFAAVAASDPEAIRGWALDATRHLYRRMTEIGDFSGALKAIKQLTELNRTPKPAATPARWTPRPKDLTDARKKADPDNPQNPSRESGQTTSTDWRADAESCHAGLPQPS